MNGLLVRRSRQQAWTGLCTTLLILALASCQTKALEAQRKTEAPRGSHPPEKPQAEAKGLVSIGKTSMKSGFAIALLRSDHSVQAFRISKHPVTWAEYDICVERGSCPPPDSAACTQWSYSPYGLDETPPYATKTERGPAVCVGQTQAEAYCKSLGGRLPTLNEWLVAARGEDVARFSWGDAPLSCDQHPLSSHLVQRSGVPLRQRKPVDVEAVKRTAKMRGQDPTAQPSGYACNPKSFDGSELSVGTHAQGASPHGVEDVLIVPGELLNADDQNPFNACSSPFQHCVVFGIEPAAIDSVETFVDVPATDATERRTTIGHAYSFRCAFDAKTSE